jgi:hypothetical protein
MIHEDFA